jgi:hypothetical protein
MAAFFQVIVPVTVDNVQFILVEFENPIGDLFKEMAIMAYDHDCARKVFDGVQERFPRSNVQMVGRLVDRPGILLPLTMLMNH